MTGLTDDLVLGDLYTKLSGLEEESREVLRQATFHSTAETRGKIASISGRKNSVWDEIRRRKVVLAAKKRGEEILEFPSKTGLRRSRWDQ